MAGQKKMDNTFHEEIGPMVYRVPSQSRIGAASSRWGTAAIAMIRRVTIVLGAISAAIVLGGTTPLWSQETQTQATADDDLSVSPEEANASPNAKPESKSNPDASAPKKTGAPPPKVVGVRNGQRLYEGTKQVREKFAQKLFSDNSVLPHGTYEEFYPDGKPFCRGEYADGLRSGEWEYWHATEKLGKKGAYRDDKPDGVWSVYRSDGTLMREESYAAGDLDGNLTVYGDDGKAMRMQRGFQKGKPNGTWTEWSPEGEKLVEMRYEQGQLNGEQSRWYPTGKLQAVEHYKQGKRHGEAVLYDQTGAEQERVQFEDGKRKSAGAG